MGCKDVARGSRSAFLVMENNQLRLPSNFARSGFSCQPARLADHLAMDRRLAALLEADLEIGAPHSFFHDRRPPCASSR